MLENLKAPETKVTTFSWKRLLAASLLVGACGVAFLISTNPFSEQPGKLFVDDRYLDFGEVWADKQFCWKLPIHNRTNQRMEVLSFGTSCSCVVSIKPRSFALEPGEVRETEFTLDLSGQGLDKKDSWKHGLETIIVPYLKGALVQQVGWKIKGTVRYPLRSLPPEINLGDQNPDDSPKDRSFVIESHPEIRSVEGKCDWAAINVSLSRVLERENKLKVNVSLAGQLKPGSFRVPVFLTPITTSGKALPPMSFYVFGNIAHDITISQRDFTYGAIRLGQKCAEVLTFRSRSGKSFDVEHKVSHPESITVLETNSKAPGIRQFQLLVRVSKTGGQKQYVNFKAKTRGPSSQPPVDFEIGVNYHGIP